MSQTSNSSANEDSDRETRRNGGSVSEPKKRISLDWWTVLAALLAALLVKVGALPAIPW
jgi:hypothetical protein